MNSSAIESRLNDIAQAEAERMNFELVRVELGGTKRDKTVRIFIDKEGGITLDDCAAFSQRVEAVLDLEDLIPTRYVLEVSSPGIERGLYSLKDFERSIGKLAKVRHKADGTLGSSVGRIAGVDGSIVSLADKKGGVVTINFEDIVKANLKIDLGEEFGTSK
jgi:ribosome maturation factor RimP